jgi:RNA polymerase sigma factor (sigma-70 family)
MKPLAFQQLCNQIKRDDARGMSMVFKETHRYCTRTLLKKTQCGMADAEDIYMDALLIFRENILQDKVEYLSNLQTYLFGICWNVWRKLNRQQGKQQQWEGEVARQLHMLQEEAGSPFEEDAEEVVKRRVKLVKNALAALGDKCQRLLNYVYVEQRAQKDIAELMGFASASVVKVTRHRCYQKWMKAIEQTKSEPHGSS